MNKTTTRLIICTVSTSLLLTSCETLGPALENTGQMAGIGAAAGAIIGGATGDWHNRYQRAAAETVVGG